MNDYKEDIIELIKKNNNLLKNNLKRTLLESEINNIINIFIEKKFNLQLKYLKKNVTSINCFIPKLTNLNGNCLFESLSILGLSETDEILDINDKCKFLRNNIAKILTIVKDFNIFPNINMTPNEIFQNSNDIEFIKDGDTNKVYEYNYEVMINDLILNNSWHRLPMELILMTISRIYQVKILVLHNKTQYITEINVFKDIIDDNNIDTIRLGLINEEHYLPVLELPQEQKDNKKIIENLLNSKLEYNNETSKYHIWEKNIKLLIEKENNESNENYNLNDFEIL